MVFYSIVERKVLARPNSKLPLTEEINFQYVLSLMRPLHDVDEFAWLPELFVLIGHEKLIDLCRYCGGETLAIPTLDQLSDSIDVLEWYYKINMSHTANVEDIPENLMPLYEKICDVYEELDD